MGSKAEKLVRLERRRKSIRRRLTGTSERPRLSVKTSLNHIYAQIIDDTKGKTLVAASSRALKITGGNVEAARAVGKDLAERAKSAAVTSVRFDRNGRLFHGRVKALAEAAREGGLDF
jgi:large subunit ribosomal protein L18